MTAEIQEALRTKTAVAHDASRAFDFEREEGLATFWRQATPGTTYWRGYLPMQYLPGSVQGVEPDTLFWEDEAETKLGLRRQHGDTAIWQFLGDDARSRAALQMQRQGLRTLMEVDDNYLRFAPPLYGKFGAWTKTHAEAVTIGNGYSVEMHRNVVPQMDGIICATDALAAEYEEWNDSVFVCPNSVDPTDWDVERVDSDFLRIGYYGSPSHTRDYPLVKKALKWAARQPGVEVVMVGFKPPGWSGPYIDWNDDLLAARQNLGKIDVGIAPLVVNAWSVGKSDVKALEYAMAGVMPILQDAPPYSPWKEMGWYWLAKTEEDWARLIKEVVSEKDYVAQVANSAKEYVLAKRTIQGNVGAWEEAIRG